MPEKTVQEVDRSLREQYQKGLSARQRQNYDYAIAIFSQVLAQEPAFYDCREALRATQFQRAGSKSGFFKKFIGAAASSRWIAKAQLALRTNPAEALQATEQILSGDPNNMLAHKILADAALALDLPRTAALSLEIVFKNSPGDKDIALKLALALAAAGQAPKAESILEEKVREHPGDNTLAQALKDIVARRSMKETGYERTDTGQASYRDLLKDKVEAVRSEQEQRQVKDEAVADQLIRDYETRLKDEPNSQKLMRTIAELHIQKKDWPSALRYYQRALDAGGKGDAALEKQVAETKARQFDDAIAQIEPSDPEAVRKADNIRSEKAAFLLEDCQRRANAYPADLTIRFELGERLLQAGRVTEAIKEFQRATNHPHLRVSALDRLGQCFAQRGIHDLAVRSLQTALAEKELFDEQKKHLLYALGCLYEKMNQPDQAIELFKQIYEVDIGYKDVSEKVDAYYAKRQGNAPGGA